MFPLFHSVIGGIVGGEGLVMMLLVETYVPCSLYKDTLKTLSV